MAKALPLSKMKVAGIGAIVAIVFIAAGLVIWNVSAFVNRPAERHEEYSIREEIVPIAELSTYQYNFTEILFYTSTNHDNPLSIDIPFSENKYIATIEGNATVYTDAERITWSPHYNVSKYLVSIDIELPHSEIKEPVALDFETLEVLENRDGLFNEFTDEQFNDLLVQTNVKQVEKAKSSGLLEKADERIQNLIETQLKNIYGQDLDVHFHFIEE